MTRIYRVEGVNTDLAIKSPCRVATTANITLSGTQTIDGVAVVADDRVLVKNQTNTVNNGIYNVKANDWERAKDFDGPRDITLGTIVTVTSGSTQSDTFWKVSTANPITIGTSNITFTEIGLEGPQGEQGEQGPPGADGTVDIGTLTEETGAPDVTNDMFIMRDASEGGGTNNKINFSNMMKGITNLTAETAVDVADQLPLYDNSATTADKATIGNLFKAITTLSSVTAATGDELLISDISDSNNAKKITVQGILDLASLASTGVFLGRQTFTSSGTWNKPVGCTQVIVTVVGGGGGGGGDSAGGGNGGTSSFGSHCSATGGATGSRANVPGFRALGGAGGVGTGGDINIKGSGGGDSFSIDLTSDLYFTGAGGSSTHGGGGGSIAEFAGSRVGNAGGNYGGGGSGGIGSGSGIGGGGGGGGTSMKYITTGLGSSETITIGAGGAGGAGAGAGGVGGAGASGVIYVDAYT